MERWYNNLDPSIKRCPFSFKEEMIFYLGFLVHGKKWSTIRQYLTGRPSNTLKNHWKCKMDKKIEFLEKQLKKVLSKFHNNELILGKQTKGLLLKLNQIRNKTNGNQENGFKPLSPELINSVKNNQPMPVPSVTQNQF